MPDTAVLMIVFTVGIGFLVAEIFLPSHGVLTAAGIGFLIYAIVRTFNDVGTEAGIVAIIGSLILVPALAVISIKYFHRTPIGKLISPPNPVQTESDVDVQALRRFVGQRGKAVSALRPVGICEFDGKRVSCISEFGVVDPGTEVEGVRVVGGNVAVVARQADA